MKKRLSESEYQRMVEAGRKARERPGYAEHHQKRVVKILQSVFGETTHSGALDVAVPLRLLISWRDTMDRHATSDCDGESYNNEDAIRAAKEMRTVIELANHDKETT